MVPSLSVTVPAHSEGQTGSGALFRSSPRGLVVFSLEQGFSTGALLTLRMDKPLFWVLSGAL